MKAFVATTVLMVMGALGATACSSNDGGGGGAADAGDAGAIDSSIAVQPDGSPSPNADASGVVTGDSSTKATACTAAPFVGYTAAVTTLSANGSTGPLAGAKIGFSTCIGFELTTSATGGATTKLTQGIAVTPLFEDPGFISALGAEIPATGDVTEAVTLFNDDVTTLIPGFAYDGGESAIVEIVLAVDAAATAPCNTTSGVTLTVTGHSEASVSYMGAAWPTDHDVASTTASTDGTRAFIGGVAGATKVAIAGTKSGCNVKLVTGAQTGEFALLAGSLTIGTATITN